MDTFYRFLLGAACISLIHAVDTGIGVSVTIPIGLAVGWFNAETSERFDHTGLYAIMLGILFDVSLLHVAGADGCWMMRLVASVGLTAFCVVGILQERRRKKDICLNM